MAQFVSPVNALSTHSKFSLNFAGPTHGVTSEGLPLGDYVERYLYDKERLGPKWRYYNSEKLTYEENSLGHRSHLELENLKGEWGLVVGCSHTEGIANYYEDLYHQKLATKLEMPFYNAGIGGGSNDMAFHNALMIILFMKINPPKYLIFQVTDLSRFLAKTLSPRAKPKDHISSIGSWSQDKVHQDIMLANEILQIPVTRLNVSLLQLSSLCNSFGIKFIPLDYFISLGISRNCLEYDDLGISNEGFLPKSYGIEKKQMMERLSEVGKLFTSNVDIHNFAKARDLAHAGAGRHEEVSVFLANVINSMEYPS